MLPFVAVAVVLSASVASASPVIEERATITSCNNDNLLRCFRASAAAASAYCSSYVSASSRTVTTVTPSTTVYSTASATETWFETSTSVVTETVTVVVTTTFTSSLTDTSTFTTGVVTTADQVQRRALENRQAAAPRCLEYNGAAPTSYPASRISSACACIGIAGGAPTPVTATAPVATITSATTITQTTTSTTVTTITTTGTTSTTATTVESYLTTEFTTVTSYAAVTPTCTIVSGANGNLRFTRYYKGSGTTLNIRNPGNTFQYRPAQSTTLPSQAPCAAATACASYANALRDYYSFDVHFLIAQGVYECRAFYDRNRDASFFDQTSANFGDAYGYSF